MKINLKKMGTAWMFALICAVLSAGCQGAAGDDKMQDERDNILATDTEPELFSESKEREPDSDKRFLLLREDYAKEAILLYEDKSAVYISLCENGEEGDVGECFVRDGYLYFRISKYDEDNGESDHFLYRMDGDGQRELITSIRTTDAVSLDVCGGELHILLTSYNAKSNISEYQENAFIRKEDGTYVETNGYQDLYNMLSSQGCDLCYAYRSVNGGRWYEDYSVAYCLDAFGMIAGRNPENQIVLWDEDGQLLQTVTLFDEALSLLTIEQDRILFTQETDDMWEIYEYDLSLGEYELAVQVPLEQKWNICRVTPEKIYYYTDDDSVYGMNQYAVYVYDRSGKESDFLYESSQQPGAYDTLLPGIDGFLVSDEICYFRDTDGTKSDWYSWSAQEGKQPLDLAQKIYGFAEYGTIRYDSQTVICPICQRMAYRGYVEEFSPNDSLPNADAVRKDLDQSFSQYLETVPSPEEMAEDEEFHKYANETYERRVENVQMLGTHYLAIDYRGYIYRGGAHGYPEREQKIYDLSSGERRTFADFYQGTQEEWKEIVTEYTLEDYRAMPEKYFAQEEETLRDEVYEYAAFDILLRMEADGVVVEYSPYHFGPYASGYIEVKIPYTALGIVME